VSARDPDTDDAPGAVYPIEAARARADWDRVPDTSSADPMHERIDVQGATNARLTAPLTWLDGAEFGSLSLLHEDGGAFSDVDAAILGHLAQMISASLERAILRRARL
jgi:GAF domain-containing protein